MQRTALSFVLALVAIAGCGVPSDFGNRPDDPSAVRLASLRTILLRPRDAEVYRVGHIRTDARADLGLSLYPSAAGDGIPPEFAGTVLVRDPETGALETTLSGTGPDDGVRARLYLRDAVGSLVLPLQLVGFMDFLPGTDPGGPLMSIRAEIEGVEAFDLTDRSYAPDDTLSWAGTTGATGATALGVDAATVDGGGFTVEVVIEEATGDDATVDVTFFDEGGTRRGTLTVESRVTLADAAGFGLLLADVDIGGTPDAPAVNGSADLTVTSDDGGWQFFHQVAISGPIATPAFVHADGDPLEPAHIEALESYWAELIAMLDAVTAAQGLPSVR